MASRTTLILVWLGGDFPTRRQIEPLLKEIQDGLDSWNPRDPLPDVYCFYHHFVRRNVVQTHSFRIERGTLHFTNGLVDSVPAGAVELTGTLPHQLMQFASDAASRLCSHGPIRIIYAAHGIPYRACHPGPELLVGLWRFVAKTDPQVLERFASSDFAFIDAPIIPVGTPPGGLTAAIGRSVADISLDQCRGALEQLPEDRLETLLLHACSMSSLEVISALEIVPHHIACEYLLGGHLPLKAWFPTLGDPIAKIEDISVACFDHIPRDAMTFNGRMSSHLTESIDDVLELLDKVGDQLYDLMTGAPSPNTIAAITGARSRSHLTTHTIDVAEFCRALEYRSEFPGRLLSELRGAVARLQLRYAAPANPIPHHSKYQGINFFLVDREEDGPSSAALPRSFQRRASDWCEFLDLWDVST